MRILQVIQRFQLRGAEVFASQLSGHLTALGHEVILVAIHSGNAALPFSGRQINLKRDKANRFLDLAGWRSLSEIIREFKPDIVQANASDTLKFVVFSKLIFRWRAKIVYRNANKVSDFIDSSAKLTFNKWLLSSVSHVVSVSEICREDFAHTYSLDAGLFTVVPVGVEPTKGDDQSPPPDLAQYFAGRKTIVHVASLVPEKNHEGMLSILEKLVSKDAAVVCLMIGEGRLRPRIEGMIKSKGLENHALLLGSRKDAALIIAQAKALVLPSRIEGLPAVLLEAMNSRTPVVAYNVGGISEVVVNGKTGWLVPFGDETVFVNSVLAVLRNEQVDGVVNEAYRLVEKEYRNDVIAKRFENAYQRLLAS